MTVSAIAYIFMDEYAEWGSMLTLTSEYALRAMVYLAQHVEEWPIPGRRIAHETRIPRKYLSRILGDLVRARILDSSPGTGGGFRIARPPKEIGLFEVLAPFEPIFANRASCPFGNEVCSDDDPCAAHDRWTSIKESYSRFLQETSVYDIAVKRRERCPNSA